MGADVKEKTAETAAKETTSRVQTRGLHHLAFLTKDLTETIKFYNGVLDMPITVTLNLPDKDPFEGLLSWPPGGKTMRGVVAGIRHYFFDCGNGSLAFFEDNGSFGDMHQDLGPMHHLSLRVNTKDELLAVRQKLLDNDIPVSNVVDHGMCWSIYFEDPNGIYLEYSVDTAEYSEEKPFLEDHDPLPEARRVLGDKYEEKLIRFREGHQWKANED